MTRQVYIYGLGGADKMYKVLAYHFITEEEITITNIVYHASMLKARNPSVETVYAIDNYPGLRSDCKASMYKSTIENCAILRTYWRCKEFKSTDKARSCREICGSFLFMEVLLWHTDIESGRSSSIREKRYLHTLCLMNLRKKRKRRSGCLRTNVDAGRNQFILTRK